MKIHYTYFTFFILSLLMSSCCKDDTNVTPTPTPTPIITSDPILRTTAIISDELPFCMPDKTFEVDLEIQGEQNANLVESIDVFASFKDKTPSNGLGATTEESLVESIPKSMVSAGELNYQSTLQTLLSATGVVESDIDDGDQFDVRFELVLADGTRSFYDEDSGTVNSLFLYTATIVYPKIITEGDWTINMFDAYGDGWQTTDTAAGDPATVTLNDGTVIAFGLCSPYAGSDYACTPGDSEATITVTIPAGTTSAEWYFPGDAYGEISLEIISPNGNLVGSVGLSTGAGPISIDYCQD